MRTRLLAVKFDLLDEMAVKFERKSLNLSLCKRPALLTCEVKQGTLLSRYFRWVQGVFILPLAGRTLFDREVKERTLRSRDFRWVSDRL